MGKGTPAKGHHGLAARGQGKLLYYHTQIAHTVRQSKDQLLRKDHHPHDHRRPDGHWAR
jgi:hypothetical protein